MISTLTGIIIKTDADFDKGFEQLVVRLRRPLAEEPSVVAGNYQEEIAIDYLESLLDFTSSKLYESVYTLLTLAASSANSLTVTNPFNFTFTVSPVIHKEDATDDSKNTFSSFRDAFSYQNGRVFMIGQPGAGKTTTLLAFARDSAVARLYNSNLSIPVIKSIHTWRPEIEVSQWLFSDLTIYGNDFLNNQNFIFILDGLDELGDKATAYAEIGSNKIVYDISHFDDEDKKKYEVININPRLILIEKLLDLTTNHQLVISIRIDEFYELNKYNRLQAIKLQALDNDQIEKYFYDLNLINIWRKAKSDSHLLEMFRTPLLLSLFTYAFSPLAGESLPDLKNLTEDKIMDLFIHRRFVHEYARHLRVPFDEPTTRRFLSILSASLLIRNDMPSISFDSETLFDVIGNIEEARRFFVFCQTMHFFQRTSSAETQFTHLKLQEYFRYFGLEITATSGGLQEREKSAEILATYHKDKAIPSLINILKSDNFPFVKVIAIYALIGMKSKDGINESFLLLEREKNPTNLKKYIEVLDQYENIKTLPVLLKIAYTDNQFLFNWTGRTLTKYGDMALGKLIKKVNSQGNSDKCKTIRLIGMFKSEAAFDTIISYLDDDDMSVRVVVVETLAKFGRQSVPYLQKLLGNDQSINLRLSAIKSLSIIRAPKSSVRIAKLLEDNNNLIRQEALDALGHISSNKSVNALGKFLLDDAVVNYEKELALNALKNIQDPSAFPFLLNCFGKSNKAIRIACAETMIVCQASQDIPHLLDIYKNESEREVLDVLVRAIGKKENLYLLPRFHDELRSKNKITRLRALLVIRQFGDPSSLSKLKLLYDTPPSPLTMEERSIFKQIFLGQ